MERPAGLVGADPGLCCCCPPPDCSLPMEAFFQIYVVKKSDGGLEALTLAQTHAINKKIGGWIGLENGEISDAMQAID